MALYKVTTLSEAAAQAVAAAPVRPRRRRRSFFSSKVPTSQLIVFSRQLATFMRAGVPILDAMRVVREQAGRGRFARALDEMADHLRRGEPLSTALAEQNDVFPLIYVDMVIAAEATGELDTVLDQLSRYLERSEATGRRVRQALLYPSIVLGLAAVVVAVLIVVVMPAFVALFADFQAELPLPTQILLGLGAFGGSYGVQTVAVVGFALGLLYIARNSGPVGGLRDRLVLRLPVVGRLAGLGIATRFARTLAILLRAGVPVVQAMDICTAGTTNRVYRRRLAPIRQRLLAGEGITVPLAQARLFGPLLIQMVKVGEETGTLDGYLEQAADFMDDDLDYATKQMMTVIEPMLIIFVAVVVGFVALSVVMPMYSILNQIR